MLEDAIAAYVGYKASKERFTKDKADEAIMKGVTVFAVVIWVIGLIFSLAFSWYMAVKSYRCNGGSAFRGVLAFLFPRLYFVLHGVGGFVCDA